MEYLWPETLPEGLRGHRRLAPLSGLPAPAHTGPDLHVSLGPGEQTPRVEVAGSGPTLTFTAAFLTWTWSQRGSWSPAQPSQAYGAAEGE